MHSIVFLTIVAACAYLSRAAPPGSTYVLPGSVNCSSSGIAFELSPDSDLAHETNLQIDIYTSNPYKHIDEYVAGEPEVGISYGEYDIVATTVYGSNARPLLYNIEQPFFAVPKSGGRNYTFGVYCTILAYENVNVTTNTTDDGHGDSGGDTIKPEDHVTADLYNAQGVPVAGSSTTIGDPLKYVIVLKDSTYAAVMPVNCKYYNPQNDQESLPFVSDNCPRPFPDDPEGYFGTITRVDQTRYELNFRAFTFEQTANSYLGISCDLQVCIANQEGQCNAGCWGGETTTSGPTESTTSGPSTTTESTTSTTTTSTTTESTTSTTTTTIAPGPMRFQVQYHQIAKRATGPIGDSPATTTLTDKTLAKVNIPGVDPDVSPNQVCTDDSLLKALYAIIGVLAILVAILVCTLGYIACTRRRGGAAKSEYHSSIYDGPYVKTVGN